MKSYQKIKLPGLLLYFVDTTKPKEVNYGEF